MWKDIMFKYPDYMNTCPLENLEDKCFTFIRSKKYISKIKDKKDVVIIAPNRMKSDISHFDFKFEFVEHVDFIFTSIHNNLYEFKNPTKNSIGKNCRIDNTAIIGVEGMHVTITPDNKRLQIKHMGNVIIEDDVMILALTTIQRAVFGSTILKTGVMIDSHVNIGHNSYIGENTVLAFGAIVGGSVTLGKNCMIGLGAILRNGINICDNVIIGMGSLVVRDITEPGIYKGSPAKFYKPYDKSWNF